jgi:PBP1b-binding outer membrane lipoprotein LpoB
MKNFIIIAVTALILTSCATAPKEEAAVPAVDSTIVMVDTTAVDSLSVPTPSVATTTVK